MAKTQTGPSPRPLLQVPDEQKAHREEISLKLDSAHTCLLHCGRAGLPSPGFLLSQVERRDGQASHTDLLGNMPGKPKLGRQGPMSTRKTGRAGGLPPCRRTLAEQAAGTGSGTFCGVLAHRIPFCTCPPRTQQQPHQQLTLHGLSCTITQPG